MKLPWSGPLLLVLLASASNVAAQSPGFWEPRTSLSTPRQEVAAAVLNGLVYCGGGLGSNRGALSTVERYDPKTKKWASVASMPTTLHHFGMAAAGGKVYAIGGYVSGFTGTDKCWVYDPSNDKWSAIANLPRARGALGVAAINGKIYAAGGVVPSVGVVGDLTVYDPTSNKWSTLASMPTPREHLGIAVLGGKLYVAGGRSSSGNFKILEVYDPANNKWTRLKDMPTARGGNGAAALNGRLIVVGGEVPGIFRETEEYDPTTNNWRSLELMSTGLHGIYPVTIGNEIMVPGGGTRAGYAASNIVLSLRMHPDGVDPYGSGTASCNGNIGVYVTHRPLPGETRFSIVSDNGPPGTSGLFAVGPTADVAGSTVLGFRTHLDLTKPILLVGVSSNTSGRGTLNVPLPKGATGLSAFSQFVWANTQACGGQGTVSSSHGLGVKVR